DVEEPLPRGRVAAQAELVLQHARGLVALELADVLVDRVERLVPDLRVAGVGAVEPDVADEARAALLQELHDALLEVEGRDLAVEEPRALVRAAEEARDAAELGRREVDALVEEGLVHAGR